MTEGSTGTRTTDRTSIVGTDIRMSKLIMEFEKKQNCQKFKIKCSFQDFIYLFIYLLISTKLT